MNSIRAVSSVVIGAHVMADMSRQSHPDAGVTAHAVVVVADADTASAQEIRDSLLKISTAEREWLRTSGAHFEATPRVLASRTRELTALNAMAMAAVAAVVHGAPARTGEPVALTALQDALEAATQGVDEMPGTTRERATHLANLRDQVAALTGDAQFADRQIALAQQAYLARFMDQRLAAYADDTPTP